nr:hypothetical protein [Tanacetum cinerariifolium]
FSDNFFISDGANRYGAQATGVAPGISVARASAVAGKVPYLVAFVALLSTRAIVMTLALCALGKKSFIWFPLSRLHIIDLGDILLLEGLLLKSTVSSGCSS